MKKIKITFNLALALILIFFFYFRLVPKNELGLDSSQFSVEKKIDSKICKAAKKNGGFILCGQGTLNDNMLDKVRGKTYSFESNKELSIEKSREYLVKLVLDILKIYNQEKLYRKYFFEYPFNIKNIKISIFFDSSNTTNRNFPEITKVCFRLNHLHLGYLVKTTQKSPERVHHDEPKYEEKKIKEGFRAALDQVKDTLSIEQLETASVLGLLDDSLVDEETSVDREHRDEITTFELYTLYYLKLLKEGAISQLDFDTDLAQIKESNTIRFEKEITFPDEKAKALYHKKVEYLKGEKEWEN